MDVDLFGWVDVGLGGTYGCRCRILYVPMLGAVEPTRCHLLILFYFLETQHVSGTNMPETY